MAITIEQNPADFATVYNDIVVTASSTNVAQPKFNYIFEVYDGSNTTLLRTLRIPPEIDYSYGVCHLQRVLEGYVSTVFFDNVTGTQPKDATGLDYDYYVRVGEEYEVAGVITQYLNLQLVSNTCFGASLLYKNFVNFDIADYELDGNTKQFLTNAPLPIKVQETQQGWITLFNDSPAANFTIKTYLADGTLDQTATITNGATAAFSMFPSAPASLNAATLATGTQPLIDSTIKTYEIYSVDGTQTSKTYTFEVTDLCNFSTLHFLNDLGGFDSFNFKTTKDAWKFEKEFYKQDPKRIQSDGSYVWSNKDREHVQYYTNQKQTIKLVSDWITEEESEWLREMFSSPEIYIEREGVMYSIKGITQVDYAIKYEYEGNMINIECDVELSIDNYRQRY